MTDRRFGPPASRSPTPRQLAREAERRMLLRTRDRTGGGIPGNPWWGRQHARVLDRLSHFPTTRRGRWSVPDGDVLAVERPHAPGRWRPDDDTDPPWFYAALPGGLEAILRDHFAPEVFPLLWLGKRRVYYFLPEPLADLSETFVAFGAVQQAVANRHVKLVTEVREGLRWCSQLPLVEVERVITIDRLAGASAAVQALVGLGMSAPILGFATGSR